MLISRNNLQLISPKLFTPTNEYYTAAMEALKKWDGGRSWRGGVWGGGLTPPQFWGPGLLSPGNS